jgi:30S ribosomal protein S31
MGKGDRKTRRGKIWRGTFGRLRRPLEIKNKAKQEAPAQSSKND